MIHVTAHAVQRFQERVCNWPDDLVCAFLNRPIFRRATAFGAASVILGTGQRVIFTYTEKGPVIVTIKPAGSSRGAMDPRRDRASNRRPAATRHARDTMLYGPEAHCGARHRGPAW